MKVFNLIKWNTLWNISQYILSFVFSIVLARYITPQEYGLTGMISIFTIIAALLVNSGFSTSIIRDKSATDEDYSSIFYFNIFLSIALYLILFFSADGIASFYNEPELVILLPLISIPLILNSFNLVQNALLIKSLNLKRQAIINLTALSISIVVGCVFVINGFGIYSIVVHLIAQSIILIIMHWTYSDWRPTSSFDFAKIKSHWKFSSNILFTSLFNQIMLNIDNLIIGKAYSTHELGIVMRAKNSKNIPENITSGTVSTVSFSVLSNINDQKELFIKKFYGFLKLSLIVSALCSVLLIVLSKEFILIFYGDVWVESIDFLKIYALLVLPNVIGVLYSQTILALGNSKLYFFISVAKRLIIGLSLIFAFYYSIKQFLVILVVLSWIAF
ncbi:lipopolysaccharide biosynthesis protein, partial [Crocinitomicaceae bacterium]|nr:lipopolysaccharide biosynthesis protein [Crocinitomicaceae bacterium]